jgi:hypothetical protein
MRAAFRERTATAYPSNNAAVFASAPFVPRNWCGESVPNLTRSAPTTEIRYCSSAEIAGDAVVEGTAQIIRQLVAFSRTAG